MKNTHFKTALLISTIAFAGIKASADTLTGTGSLQSWNASALGTTTSPTPSGTPYWNNLSGDGATANIGWCLTGTGTCSIANQPGAVPYYGNASGTAATSMAFTSTGVPVAASILGLFSNQAGVPNGTDYFGWYAINSNNTLGAMTQLFSSLAPVGTTASFLPTAQYGFYLENVQGAGTPNEADYFWFMNSGYDMATGTGITDGLQHFSTFALPDGTFIFGIEDTNGPGADGDFNDMIVGVENTPEPASLALLGTGLVLGALWTRRRRKA